MPIEVTCSECQKRLRVPDKVAGKRIKCPKCGAVVRVPEAETAASPEPKRDSASPPSAKTNSAATWWLKTEDGEQYGPVPKPELDEWFEEGRITADCQLLLDGADQWQWASDIYSQLESSADPATSAPTPAAPVIPEPTIPAPVGPVVVSEPTASAEVAPDAFSFAAADTKATSRVRGRKRVRKVVKRPAGSAGPANPPDPGGLSDKSKVVAGLLGIFLGCYGVHRFYLGYTGLGLIMLFTCGGCGIWSFIDAILVFAGSVPDAQGRPLR